MEVADRIARVNAGFVRISVSGRFGGFGEERGTGCRYRRRRREEDEWYENREERDKSPVRRGKEERYKAMVNIQTRQRTVSGEPLMLRLLLRERRSTRRCRYRTYVALG